MQAKNIPPPESGVGVPGETSPAPILGESAQRILTIGLELTKRAADLRSLEELYFFLVNDLRVLIEFDRSFLITHLRDVSRVAAAGNQPAIDAKSKLQEQLGRLAPELTHLHKGLFLAPSFDPTDERFKDLPADLKDALQDYLSLSGSAYTLVVPLTHRDVVLAHLVLEFGHASAPNQAAIMALFHVAPVFGSVLVEKWLTQQDSGLLPRISSKFGGSSRTRATLVTYGPWAVGALLLLLFFLFLFPVAYTVGGEAEVTSREKHLAFCQIDGLIEKVTTAEGASVRIGDTLASLDPRELDFKIESSRREYEVLSKQAVLLGREADKEPSKLAEAQIVELKRRKVLNDLEYNKWQRQFIEIKAPAQGVVITKDVESLAGKKLKAGEVFCEIGEPKDVCVEVLVPEDKISMAKMGHPVYVYLNNNPLHGYRLTVDRICPTSEVIQRLGNVCRVRSKFSPVPQSVWFGMKGIGKIQVADTTLWAILRHHVVARWNRLSLHL
jgi:multidrug resistance efflux pump